MIHNNITILNNGEVLLRHSRIKALMRSKGIDFALITDNATLYYLTGRVFAGYIGIYADDNIDTQYFVRRPIGLSGNGISYIRKPEDIPAILSSTAFSTFGLELDIQPYSACTRLANLFPDAKILNISSIIRQARSVKTVDEQEKLIFNGKRHTHVYGQIPSLFHQGMTDIEFQIEIERLSRTEGCLGQFRICGNSMELFMANILAGDNADNPTPYDFAMGGEGSDYSLPVGANGTILRPGTTVMVDCNGNYSGYMTDMTRVFAIGEISDIALAAHRCSIEICHTLEKIAKPGVEAKVLYEKATQIADNAGLGDYFMGHCQKAGFIGHGVGIEINEAPVLAPRSRDILEVGNVIAIEPKFVIPGTGAVGIENTYIVKENGLQPITLAPEEIIYL